MPNLVLLGAATSRTLPSFVDSTPTPVRPLTAMSLQATPVPVSDRLGLMADGPRRSLLFPEHPSDGESVRLPVNEPGTTTDIHGWRSFGWWAFGAVTGFFAHESAHVFANLVQGNVPKIQPIWGLGFAPFFAIEPRIYCDPHGHCTKHDGSTFHGGVPGSAAITSAGLNVQHLTDEVLLTLRPNLRRGHIGPYRKGLFAFNILLSVGYAFTSVTRLENQQGDVTSSTRTLGFPREIYAAEIFAIAAVDTYRYFVPESRWAPWVSRAGKLAFFGMVFFF